MTTLRVVSARGVAPERLARLGSGLLAQELGAATLLVAELDQTAVLLGRHQRTTSAIDAAAAAARGLPLGRRLGGGKTILVVPGTVAVLLAVPPGARLGGTSAMVSADRAINRHVRGLLRGLSAAGAAHGAFYFGRDFVSADHRQLAIVSQDGAAHGTMLFEAYVATNAPLALPEGLSRYPPHGDPRAAGPPHTCLAELTAASGSGVVDFATMAAKIATGYALVTSAQLVPAEAEELVEGEAPAPAVAEDEEGFAWSGIADVPIGFLEALVRHEHGRVLAARLRGDFIAPAFVVRALEASLAGCSLDFASIAPRVDAALALPGAAIQGVTQLRVIAEAFVACAG